MLGVLPAAHRSASREVQSTTEALPQLSGSSLRSDLGLIKIQIPNSLDVDSQHWGLGLGQWHSSLWQRRQVVALT